MENIKIIEYSNKYTNNKEVREEVEFNENDTEKEININKVKEEIYKIIHKYPFETIYTDKRFEDFNAISLRERSFKSFKEISGKIVSYLFYCGSSAEWTKIIQEMPNTKKFIQHIVNIFNTNKISGSGLLKIEAGKTVDPHIDYGPYHLEYQRLIFVVKSNKEFIIQSGGEKYNPKENDLILFNNTIIHSANNLGNTDVLLLLMDIKIKNKLLFNLYIYKEKLKFLFRKDLYSEPLLK